MDSYYSLPFTPGTRKLTLQTLNSHSAFRKPVRGYMRIYIKQLEFAYEMLTLAVKIEQEAEEKVYFKVTDSELLVSCSVDTDESYLSRYAYFAIHKLMDPHHEFDFEEFYWPGFFDHKTGGSKFLAIKQISGEAIFYLKTRYHGIYKPGQQLPVLIDEPSAAHPVVPTIAETVPKNDEPVLGFCLADTHPTSWHSNHWPFLVPYLGVLDRNKTFIKGFKSYVLNENDLFLAKLTDEQEQLVELCIAMKKIARMDLVVYVHERHLREEKDQNNRRNFPKIYRLWQQAMPILAGRLYTHYYFTYGMRNVKRKPRKHDLKQCKFSSETPELCFIWKEFDDYYKLELRFKLGKQIYTPSYLKNTVFFVNTDADPKTYYLLKSFTDCQVMSFFHQKEFKLLILKVHYNEYCEGFVDQLRGRYEFMKR